MSTVIRGISRCARRAAHVRSALMVVLLLSLTMNLLQGHRLRKFADAEAPADLLIGSQLPPVTIRTDGGELIPVSFGSDPRNAIIYYYSDSCGWCARNVRNVIALREAVRGRYRFIAIRVESRSKQQDLHAGLEADIAGVVSERARQQLGLGGTPHTLLVSSTGTVVRSWRGAFRSRIERELSAHFRLSLPGLTPQSAAD